MVVRRGSAMCLKDHEALPMGSSLEMRRFQQLEVGQKDVFCDCHVELHLRKLLKKEADSRSVLVLIVTMVGTGAVRALVLRVPPAGIASPWREPAIVSVISRAVVGEAGGGETGTGSV